MLQNWRQHDECSPFSDDNGNLYIVVESAYESPGENKEQRLDEALIDGIFKLLRFYGKEDGGAGSANLYSVSEVQDYFVSYKPCVRMKVLIRVPQDDFDSIPDDTSSCDVIKPEEGYLEARLSIFKYREEIQFVTHTIESVILPLLARSTKFISNVNILAELKRLKQTISIIDRYLARNGIAEHSTVSCPPEPPKILTVGYTYDYDAIFALIDNEQHTIGYECFLDNAVMNHITTANYLIQISQMYDFLVHKDNTTFDIFEFLTRFTLPTPIIKTKQNPTDGLSLHDDNGVSFGLADLAKLLSLDLDINLCKSAEELAQEEDRLLDAETRRKLKDSAEQITKFVGDNKLSSEGVQRLKNTLNSIQTGPEAFNTIYVDVMAKVDLACVLNEALQCYIDRTIELAGDAMLGDSDLGQLIDTSISLGNLVDANCNFQPCDGSPDVDLALGLPIFQGIEIPDNFPTLDYLSEVIDKALNQLYAALITAIASAIINIISNSCKFVFDDVLGEGSAISSLKDGFQDWFGESLGVSYEDLSDPEAWGNALTSAGGTGFIGAIGNMVSRGVESGYAAYAETGISLNLPDPQNGWQVDEVFVSAESIQQFTSDLKTATEDVNVILTPSEQISLFKGMASDETVTLAFKCLEMRNPAFSSLFKDRYEFADMFAAMGKLIKPEIMASAPDHVRTPPPDFCHLSDGSDARMLREALLTEKDPDLSAEEINNIIDKELEHNAEKIGFLQGLLEKILNGTMAPSFPPIFGGEDSLIPEIPESISQVLQAAADGIYGPAITNFNIEAIRYKDLWAKVLSEDEIDEHTGAQRIILRNIFDYSDDVQDENRSESKYIVDGNVGIYRFGYLNHVTPKASHLPGELGYFGGEITTIYEDFGKNFKGDEKDDLRERLSQEFGLSEENAASKKIVSFIEDKDEEDGYWTVVIYDSYNTLRYYIITVAHEGGKTGSDRQTDVMLTKVEYKEEDQPVVAKLTHEYGSVWGWRDNNKLEEKFKQIFGSTHWDPMLLEYINSSVAGENLNNNIPSWAEGATLKVATDKSTLYVKQKSSWASAERFAPLMVIPDTARAHWPIDLSTTYDITVRVKDNKVDIEKREISDDLLPSTTGAPTRTSDWPTSLVSITKDRAKPTFSKDDFRFEELQILPISTGKDTVQQDIQRYTIGNTHSTLGNKIGVNDTSGLLTIEYDYEKPNSFFFQLSLIKEQQYPSQAVAMAQIISSTLNEFFTTDDDKKKVNNIAKKILDTSHKDLCNSVVEEFGKHIARGSDKYWEEGHEEGNYDRINLTYPVTDILQYDAMNSEMQEFASNLLDVGLKKEYCDSLSALRRTIVSYGIVLLSRIYIVEHALITLPVSNAFDITFMDSELFRDYIYSAIETEIGIYQNSFEDTLSSDLWQEMLNNVEIYYDIRRAFGEDIPTFESKKNYFKELISQEITNLKSAIRQTLNLRYNWSNTKWDGFIMDRIFPLYDASSDVNDNTAALSTEGYNDDNVIYDVFATEPQTKTTTTVENGGVDYTFKGSEPPSQYDLTAPTIAFEKYVKFSLNDSPPTIDGYTNFLNSLEHEDFAAKITNMYTSIIFGLRMVYVHPFVSEEGSLADNMSKLSNIALRSSEQKAFELENQVKNINNNSNIFRFISIPLISTECEYGPEISDLTVEEFLDTIKEQYDDDIFPNLRQLLWETNEYRAVVDSIIPLQDIAAAYSIYGYAALSDEGVFDTYVDGTNLYQLMAKSKLSIMQIIEGSKQGAESIVYIDPFLQKAGIDNI